MCVRSCTSHGFTCLLEILYHFSCDDFGNISVVVSVEWMIMCMRKVCDDDDDRRRSVPSLKCEQILDTYIYIYIHIPYRTLSVGLSFIGF